MKTVVTAVLLLASVAAAQARISINGPAQSAAAAAADIGILSIDLPGR